jgi:hypothetical protein
VDRTNLFATANVYRGDVRAVLAIAVGVLLFAGGAAAKTIVGTASADRLSGTSRTDAIFGLAGGDRVVGGDGADFLHGGPGRDVLDGDGGNDLIAAQYDGGRDRVTCGPGLDIVNADLLDTVTGDCELVARRLSRDPYRNADSSHETEVEPDSFTFGRTTVATFQVGRRFDGGAANIGFAVSVDDGRTWRSGLLPRLTAASSPPGISDRASDPVVAYDATSRTWLIGTLALQGQVTRLTISRSPDGFTWSDPVVAAEATFSNSIAFDKEWLACDNGSASTLRGRCYLAYSDVVRGGAIGVTSSVDGGLTWSVPTQVPLRDAVGVVPVIKPAGELVLVYYLDPNRIGASVSTDGAATFGTPVTISEMQFRSARGLRFFPLPAADADSTGRVWAVWHDCRFSSGCSTNSVVVSTSQNGVTWTQPRAVTAGRNAFIPAIGIHPTSGRVAIAYYLLRPAGIDLEVVESRIGGSGWAAPRRLSAQTMREEWLPNTVSGRMLADYISVHYAGTRPLVVWALASEPVGSSFRQAIYATRG